jgi:uncharacterized protein (DUF885 family)
VTFPEKRWEASVYTSGMKNRILPKMISVAALLLVSSAAFAQQPAWIVQSNEHARVLLEVTAKYVPEQASAQGVDGHDEGVFDLKPRIVERQLVDLEAALAKLTQARDAATDPLVKQDLQILVTAAQRQADTLRINDRLMLPYFDLPRALFQGFQNILDERVPKERHAAALIRLRRYAGAEKGYEPITALYEARMEEKLADTKLVGPWTTELESNLKNQARYVEGIRELLQKSGLKGWQKNFATLSKQLDDYAKWMRETVQPRARPNNQLPLEVYADNLKNFGVDMDPHQLIDRAQTAYAQTRDEMATIARLLAAQRGWKSHDYRDVIRELKKERIANEKLLEVYNARLAAIEDVVRKEQIVSLPKRPAVIRLASEAESAAQPAPHIDPPRLIGNTGEPAEFVLPTRNPSASTAAEMDDFNYDGITWTLTAHEARPGHELQFARMMERGVSTARVIFAFNSANIEGWALYAEAVMKQHLPLEGQIGSLQMRLMRAARAFLDPMLNLGMIEPAAAKRLLMEEVMLSEPMAQQEVDRYTFRSPGQATSYFYGYNKLEALRTKAEIALPGGKFKEGPFHDFIVNQGLLPLDLLERAVLEDFVRSQQ